MRTARPGDTTPVSAVMTRDALTVRPEQPVEAAVAMLLRHRITGVLVVDDGGSCAGVVSEADVLGKRGRTCGEIMSTDVVSVEGSATVVEAADLLLRRRIRRLPVTDGGRVVGVLTRMDLLRHLARSHWACRWCGSTERGLRPPQTCGSCGGGEWRFVSEA